MTAKRIDSFSNGRESILSMPKWEGRFRDLCLELFAIRPPHILEGESETSFNIRKAEEMLRIRGIASEIMDMSKGFLDLRKEGAIGLFKKKVVDSLARLSSTSTEDDSEIKKKADIARQDLYKITGVK